MMIIMLSDIIVPETDSAEMELWLVDECRWLDCIRVDGLAEALVHDRFQLDTVCLEHL